MQQSRSRQIVVAEDDPSARRLLVAQLRAAGYEVRAFDNGRDALEAIRDGQVGIVIADWTMPGLDGLELCHAVESLRASGVIGVVYFILLTAHTELDMLVRGLQAGASDYLTKPYHKQELLARLGAAQRVIELHEENYQRRLELEQKNAELDVLTRRLERQANTDALTGIANRRFTLRRLDELWNLTLRSGQPLTAIVLDIDRFKAINDVHGHAAGDAVLVETVERCQQAVRSYDVLGRFGGEEFLVVCPEADLEGGAAVAERMRAAIADRPFEVLGHRLNVTASLGVASRTTRHDKSEALVADADTALYKAKQHGRNRVWLLDESGTEAGQPTTALGS